MKAFALYLLATAGLGLGLTGCTSSPSKEEAAQTTETAAPANTDAISDAGAPSAHRVGGSLPASPKPAAAGRANPDATALPAGLKVGRWQGYFLAQKRAIHFVFEVAVEDHQVVAYLINEGPGGQERLRCNNVQTAADSAIIRLPATGGALVVHAEGADHLAGAWVKAGGKTPSRLKMSAIYGELTPFRTDVATPNFAGAWRATFAGSTGKTYSAAVVFEQQGAKLVGSCVGPGGNFRFLSGAALPEGMSISSFNGSQAILFQAHKLPNGTLKGDFYSGKSGHDTWTAVPVPQASAPK